MSDDVKLSNCLVETLKQKVKNPTLKVYYVKPYNKDGLPHFCWWDNTAGSYRHFTSKGCKPWWRLAWFKGHIDNFPYEKLKIKLIRIL